MEKDKISKILTKILFACFFIAVLAICANVYLYGDDFFYSTFSKKDFAYYISRNIEHYRIANGRAIVHVLATMFLGMNLWVWRIVNAVAFTACAVLSMHIVKPQTRQMPFCAAIMIFIFLTLDTQITRQSIYWLTGSLNYLYPMLMLLLYWFCLQRSLSNEKHAGYLPILAFLASATTEQGSMMCFGLTLLLLVHQKFVIKRNIKLSHILSLVFSFLGVLSVVCAPGVFNRVDVTESPVSGGLFDLVIYNLSHQWKHFFFAEYTRIIHITLLVLSIFCIASFMKNSKTTKMKNIHTIGLLLGIIVLICYIWLPKNIAILPKNALTVKMSIFMFCIALGMIATLFMCAVSSFMHTKDPVMIIALILGFGSQIVMMVSPVYGPRVLVSFIFMAAVFAVKAVSESINEGGTTVLGGIASFLAGQPYMVVLTVPALYWGRINKEKIKLTCLYLGLIPLALPVLLSWNKIYSGYVQNTKVYKENISAIKEYNAISSTELKQYKLPNEYYAWAMPYQNKYYDPYYNICFDLPKETKINWQIKKTK